MAAYAVLTKIIISSNMSWLLTLPFVHRPQVVLCAGNQRGRDLAVILLVPLHLLHVQWSRPRCLASGTAPLCTTYPCPPPCRLRPTTLCGGTGNMGTFSQPQPEAALCPIRTGTCVFVGSTSNAGENTPSLSNTSGCAALDSKSVLIGTTCGYRRLTSSVLERPVAA